MASKTPSKFRETSIGEIPEEWQIQTVEELVTSQILEKPLDGNHGGIHPKQDDYVTDGIPFVMASDVNDGTIDLVNCKFIKKTQADALQKGFSFTGDVLLTHKGAIGRTAIVGKIDTDYIMLTPQVTYYRIKNKSKIDQYFLKYYFDSKQFQFLFKSWAGSGSTRDYLGITEQRKLPILLPIIQEQRGIANVLSTLDSKIKLSQSMNRTLEAVGRAVFKRWFVDFEFPNQEGKPYKSSGGEMVDSEIGNIPQGWTVNSLGNIVLDIIDYRGKTPKKLGGEWSEKGIMAISAMNIKQNRLVRLNQVKFVNENLYKKWMKKGLLDKDIIMTSEAPLGELYYLVKQTKICLSQRLFSIRANPDIIKPAILYYLLNSFKIQHEIQSRATGTTVLGIRQSELRNVPIPVPDNRLQNKIELFMETILENIETNQSENENLMSIRDLLLPKLISGKIRVPVVKKENIEAR